MKKCSIAVSLPNKRVNWRNKYGPGGWLVCLWLDYPDFNPLWGPFLKAGKADQSGVRLGSPSLNSSQLRSLWFYCKIITKYYGTKHGFLNPRCNRNECKPSIMTLLSVFFIRYSRQLPRPAPAEARFMCARVRVSLIDQSVRARGGQRSPGHSKNPESRNPGAFSSSTAEPEPCPGWPSARCSSASSSWPVSTPPASGS